MWSTQQCLPHPVQQDDSLRMTHCRGCGNTHTRVGTDSVAPLETFRSEQAETALPTILTRILSLLSYIVWRSQPLLQHSAQINHRSFVRLSTLPPLPSYHTIPQVVLKPRRCFPLLVSQQAGLLRTVFQIKCSIILPWL